MRIRTQLLVALAIFAILIALISVLVIVTNREVERLTAQGELAENIALEAGELGYLSSDYILYREPQQKERWQAKYDSISGHAASLSVDRAEEMAIAGNLAANLKNTRAVFEDIVSGPVPAGGTGSAVIQLSWGRMAVQSQGMIFDAGRLARLLREEADGLKQTSNLLIMTLMGTFVAFLLTSYFFFYRRTVRSIDDLQAGTEKVGSGDLTHVIDESADDEIGDLARAFNRMTRSLNTVTATKMDLEKEVSERKQAEGALRESEGRLKALYSSMSEGLANHQVIYGDGRAVDYQITDVNPAYEVITGLRRESVVGRMASDVYGMDPPPYLDTYARVASAGTPEHFETFYPPLGKHFAISVFSPGKGRFATVFTDITARKQAEEALRESELRFRTVAENTYDWEFWLDPAGRFIYCSPSCERITGYRAEEFLADPGLRGRLIHPDDREMFDRHIHEEGERQQAGGGIWRFVRPDGTWRWIEHVCQPVYGGKGEFIGIRGSNRDITDRKQAEEALRESEERFRTIAETSPIQISVSSSHDATILYANTEYAQAFGFSGEELIGVKAPDLYCNQDDRGELINTLKTEGSVRNREVRVKRKDGTPFWVVTSVTPIRFGGTDAFLGASIDITDRKRAERALHETSQYLENLINHANAPIIVWDPQFRITRFNHAFERLSGRTAEEVIGRDLGILFPEDTMWGSMDQIRRTLEGEHWVAVEIPILTRNGELRTVLWNSATLYGPDGRTVVSAIAQGQDITERKKAEEALRETSQYLENLINYANAPIIVWDPQFRITRFNRAFERLTGRTAAEVLGQDLGILFPDERKSDSMDHIRKTVAGERWEVVEIPILTKKGEVRTVLWNSATLYGPDGKTVLSAIAQGQDITERNLAEEALRENEEHFKLLYQGLPISAVVFQRVGEDFVIRDYNQASQVFTGGTMETFVGKTARELYGSRPDI
ncbi:MAG: PAS domain S-box protein, partial [Methanomicrobiales archaeon]|nr:PAS domain S-box protein [Methanomicrobiales archaeon]